MPLPEKLPEKPLMWRRSPDNPILVTAAEFARIVAENDLKPIEVDGYLWAWKPNEDGFDCYRAYGPKWCMLYQARRVATQANVGGGAVTIDITVGAGQTARVVAAEALNGGTNSIFAQLTDEDNNRVVQLASVGSAAGTNCRLPNIGTAGSASANLVNSTNLPVGPGSKLTFNQGGAGAQNDTLTVAISLLLPVNAVATDITWSVARSTNPGDVTLAASTISAANTMQAVLLP